MEKRILILLILIIGLTTVLEAQLMTESFEGIWPPANWQIINAGTGNNWTQLISANLSSSGSACMTYSYNHSQAANAWAISAAIPMIAGRSYRVEFDQKVYEESYPEYLKVTLGTAQTVAAQTFTWLNYPSPGLSNTTYLNRVSQEYLCLQSGNYYLGFNCYSKKDMFILFIDNVRFYETILNEVPSPAACISPLNTATNVMNDNTFSWAAQSGNVDGYLFSLGTDNPPTSVCNNAINGMATTYAITGLEYDTTYYWQVVPHNETGLAANCPIWSYTTGPNPNVTAYPHNESYDTAIPPYGWHDIPTVGTRNWSYATITSSYPQFLPHSGAGMASYNVSGTANGSSAVLISPPFNANSNLYYYNLDLWMLRNLTLSSYADKIEIYYSATPDLNHANSLLATVHRSMYLEPVSAEIEGWHLNTINELPFTTGSVNYIIIKAISASGSSIYIDDMQITRTLIQFPPLPCISPMPVSGAFGVALDSNLSWQPADAEPTGYRLYLGTNNPPNDVSNGIDLGNVLSYNPVQDLTANTRYYWQVVPYSAAGNTLNCPIWSFSTLPTPAITNFPYINNFDEFLPAYWSLQGNGVANWTAPNSSFAGGTFPEASIIWTPQFIGISRLVSPSLDTRGSTTLFLNFKTRFSYFSGAIEVSAATRHGYGAWTTVWSHLDSNLDATEIALSIQNDDIGYANTQVCFFVSGDSYNMNYWKLDDIIISTNGLQEPQNLQLSHMGEAVVLSWNAVSGATGYFIWKAANPYLEFDPETQINWQKLQPNPQAGTSIQFQPVSSMEFYRITATTE